MSRTVPSSRICPVFAALLLLISASAFGYGFHDSQAQGSTVPGFGVASIAQSGAWTTVVEGPLAALANPAMIRTQGGRTRIAATGGILTWREEVHLDTTTSKRTDWLPTAYTLGGAFRLAEGVDAALAAGRVSDFSYSGRHELPEDPFVPGAVDSLEELVVSGSLYEVALGVGVDGPAGVRLGVGSGLLIGSADYDYSVQAAGDPESLARTESWSWSQTEPIGHVGLNYDGSIGQLSAAYISGSSRYSPRLGVSAMLLAERIGHTLVGFEAELISPLASNEFVGRYHMSIPLRSSIDMLTGMSFRESPNAHRTSLGFSFGCKLDISDVSVGLGLDWQSKDRQGSSFPREQANHVYDSGTIIAAEISTRL